jgi:hypothetical protein
MFAGLRLFLGLVIGFCIGLTGVGGGVLVMPALTVVLGLPAPAAVGTASLYAFITKIMASYSHHRLGNVQWLAVRLTLLGAVPACIAVAAWVNWTLHHLGVDTKARAAFETGQGLLIAGVVLFAAVYMIVQEVRHRLAGPGGPDESLDEELMDVPAAQHGHAVSGVAAGALIGALIAATSVGGGVILVPLLFAIFRTTPRQTVGTSIVVALVLTLVTALVYGKGGELDVPTGLTMGVAALVGARFGAKCTGKVPQAGMRGILVAVIVFSALVMLWKQFG